MDVIYLSLIIFFIASLMTMTGRGGGNFYVLAIVLSGFGMHQAATTGQLILFLSALSATLIFGKNRIVEWRLVIYIGSLTAISAFFGGLLSSYFTSQLLKYIFSFFLILAAILMVKPIKQTKKKNGKKKGTFYWTIKSKENEYNINLLITLPIVIATGFIAGMVGVSGGSFLVPLMVLACNVPMKIAVGTSTTMVSATALMGFIGHSLSCQLDYKIAIPLSIAGVIGGLIGSKISLKTKPKKLKLLFAYTTFAAAIMMVINAYLT